MNQLGPFEFLLGGFLLGVFGIWAKNAMTVGSALKGQEKMQEKLNTLNIDEAKNNTLKEVEDAKRAGELKAIEKEKAKDVSTEQLVDFFNDMFDPNKRK